MDLDNEFKQAADRVKQLTQRPSNNTLLDLYALYKQGEGGDIAGKRPGLTNLRGRAKYDAWAKRKGMGRDEAKKAYVALVDSLMG